MTGWPFRPPLSAIPRKSREHRWRAHAVGDTAAARRILDAVEPLQHRTDSPLCRTRAANRRAGLHLGDGDTSAAAGAADEALTHAYENHFLLELIVTVEILVGVACSRESWPEAAHLAGAAARLRHDTGIRVRFPPDADRLARDLDTTRVALGDDRFNQALAEGRALDLDGVVAYAHRTTGEHKGPSHRSDSLKRPGLSGGPVR